MKIGKYYVKLNLSSLIVPGIFWVIALVYIYESRNLWEKDAMLLVRWCVVAMAIATVFSLYKDLEIKKIEDKEVEVTKKAPLFSEKSLKLIVFIAATSIYVYLMTVIGFIFATLLYIAGIMYFLGERKPIVIVLVPLGTTTFIYLMFDAWLKISLPAGILGF